MTGRSSAKSSGPAPGRARSWHVCPGPLHMCPLPRLLSVATRRMASPLPHLTPTSEPQNTQERWCAGWGSCRRQRPPRTTLSPQHSAAHGLPSRVPGAAFFSGSWPCSHIVSTSSWSLCCVPHAAHAGDTADGRLRLALPTLFPESSEKKKESYVSMQVHRSPVGSVHLCLHVCPSVCKRTRAHPCRQEPCQAPTLSTWQVRGRPPSLGPAALPPLCPPSTPPTVRSSWGLKKEASYPRGSTCKEKQESRHGRKVRHCLGFLREKKAKTLLILAKNKA